MKRAFLLIAAVSLLPGCVADLGFRYGNTTPSATQPSVGPGGSMAGGGVSVRASDGPVFGAAVGGILGVIFQGTPSKKPELETSRPVQQQDCTRPIDATGANLRCR